ncbi:helix-turn-helix transcriptional regulator [Hymenobacter sp. ASUV-10]|uniref:Helix-turn-helix transcriptional regulator n=1 Tax=Hymenobacter aranciens TaxID=3063996 RepID=A0ABT9BJR0_9BACT|nr:helix-turn-helix transcriptional regulator [Hymenobacter sp. ASUV-10]MDO7876881.1 helix-turn-helix transcriptional regulator [Hymenobacter sp. ASUV-10]
MPGATYSTTLAADVRAHFGLTQAELAAYLGVSPGQVAHLEAGRRQAAVYPNLRLTRLAQLLPPPEGTGAVAPASSVALRVAPAVQLLLEPAGGPALLAVALRRRQRQCITQMTLLGHAIQGLQQRIGRHERRRWATAVLATLLAPEPGTPFLVSPAEQLHIQKWLATLEAVRLKEAGLYPGWATTLTLQLVRRAALEAEATTLAGVLSIQTVAQT